MSGALLFEGPSFCFLFSHRANFKKTIGNTRRSIFGVLAQWPKTRRREAGFSVPQERPHSRFLRRAYWLADGWLHPPPLAAKRNQFRRGEPTTMPEASVAGLHNRRTVLLHRSCSVLHRLLFEKLEQTSDVACFRWILKGEHSVELELLKDADEA